MANTYVVSMRNSYLLICKNSLKLLNLVSLQPMRLLYCKSTLGIDNFVVQQRSVRNQLNNIADKFKEKMIHFSNEEEKNMIFTEDLKNMIHLSEDDDDILLVVKMMKKFNQQNKQVRFGNYIFGPVVMRLFHLHNKADLALECFKSEELNGFFDQLISYQILLDLLYENKKYNEMLEAYELIQQRQIEGMRFPKNIVTLAMAACYKLNSQESLKYALNIWKAVTDAGHFPMRRCATFCAGLTLNQGQPAITLEVLSAVKNQTYTTVRNLKVAALADVGRVEDAIPILKSILNQDYATDTVMTFNRDVLERVKNVILKLDNPDISLEFNRLYNLFEQQGNITNLTLNEQLCAEIQKPPEMQLRQSNRFSRFNQNNSRDNKFSVYRQRPGLNELV